MYPLSRSIIPGRKACMQWTTPQRFTPTTNSQSATGVWVKGADQVNAGVVDQQPGLARVLAHAPGQVRH